MAKTLTTQLKNLFATGQMSYCGLYKFVLSNDSGTLYYASGDVDIFLKTSDSGGDPFWANQYFSAGGVIGPYFDRKDNKAKMHVAVGLQVDTLVFDVIPASSTINGAPFLEAVREGVFDGAELTYLGAYWPGGTYAIPVIPTGTVVKYIGNVAEVDISRNLATFTINSYLELLNQNLPLNLFQATCVNTLYDASCTLSQSSFQSTGSAGAGSTNSTIYSVLSQATGYFNLGTITFTSGVNSGVSRTISTFVNNGSNNPISVIAPFPSAPSPGDTFDIYPGCDKTQSTCAQKFNNLRNFRGFPFIPQMENSA
jgi:uncharacterized phage protein (TIGR02218 family)